MQPTPRVPVSDACLRVAGVVGLAGDHLPRLFLVQFRVRVLARVMPLHLRSQLVVGRGRQRLAADVALDDSLAHDPLASSWAVRGNLSAAFDPVDPGPFTSAGPPDASTSWAASSAAPRTPAWTPCQARRMLVARPSPGTT